MLTIQDIHRMLPHRYPFSMIDRVLELEEGVRCLALKNVTINEAFFQGHFPGVPVMPGVLILEAMAQACGLTAHALEEAPESKLLLFVGIDNARFKRQVVPGDQLMIETRFKNRKLSMWVFDCKATVDGKLASSAEIRVATSPRQDNPAPQA